MTVKAMTKEALEKAYKSNIIRLYNVLNNTLITSQDSEEEIQIALTRFKKGIELAQKTYSEAIALIDF